MMYSLRKAVITMSILMTLIVVTSYLLILDHASTYPDSEIPPCSLAQFDPNCSPSGWMSFLLGDLVVAMSLGFFLFYMGVRQDAVISKTTSDVKKILEMTQNAEKRRAIFVSQAMKNHFSVLLMGMGLMNRLLLMAKSYDDIQDAMHKQHVGMDRVIQRAHATLAMSVDFIDPLLIDEITHVLDKIESIKVDSGLGKGFPDYGDIKDAIKHCTLKLDEAIDYDAILK